MCGPMIQIQQKRELLPEFAGLRETVEKAAGFVAGIESTPEQITAGADASGPGSAEASYSQQVDDLAGERAGFDVVLPKPGKPSSN